ncbi:MAG: hypothetical protein SRB1_00588 [Desulfobacteraceae bacterium Eth-SRB1]|nr:MAG: hypothetical protein SRB1_00588 [Desulfobacteraceae bacterium Eth-SRB1]
MEMVMVLVTLSDKYPVDNIKLRVDVPDLDFSKAKDLAQEKARERCKDPMLLSWHNGKTGEFYPRFECGSGNNPPWIVFAEARGGNLTIDIKETLGTFSTFKLVRLGY